jgi:hypothetical protein
MPVLCAWLLLSMATAVLLADLEFDTVDFAPSFDGSQVFYIYNNV